MTEIVRVEGLRELRAALLKTIPANMQGKVLQKALSAGAKPMVKAAREFAPKRSGTLRRAIFAFRVRSTSTGAFEERAIRPRSGKKFQKSKRDAYYWRFVEFGTKFMPSTSFMRRAFDSKKEESLREITKALKVAIETAAARARWS